MSDLIRDEYDLCEDCPIEHDGCGLDGTCPYWS